MNSVKPNRVSVAIAFVGAPLLTLLFVDNLIKREYLLAILNLIGMMLFLKDLERAFRVPRTPDEVAGGTVSLGITFSFHREIILHFKINNQPGWHSFAVSFPFIAFSLGVSLGDLVDDEEVYFDE